jgi:hypothetical protein
MTETPFSAALLFLETCISGRVAVYFAKSFLINSSSPAAVPEELA